MGYKGLDFGTGISHYGDLMAQGFKDRQDLQMRQAEIDRQMAQQKIHNDILETQANYLYGHHNELYGQPGGPAGVAAFNPSISGAGNPSQIAAANGAPQNAVSQLASRNPASPYPNDPIMAPPPAPEEAPEQKMVSPFDRRNAQELYYKQIAAQAAANKLVTTESGKNYRAGVYHAGQAPENKAVLSQINALSHAKAQLLSGKDFMGVPLTGVAAQTRDAQIQKIDEELGGLAGGAKAQSEPTLTKRYSPSTNKTYSVDGSGKIVKIEDGHVY